MGQLNRWLQTLRDVYRLHRPEPDALADSHKMFDRLVELNVLEQCINIIKLDHIQRAWYKISFPEIHGWVFNVRTGNLKDLGLDTEKVFSDVRMTFLLRPTIHFPHPAPSLRQQA